MKSFVPGLFLILAALIIGYICSPLPFYLKPKEERLFRLWNKDIQKLSLDHKFKTAISQIQKIEVHFTDPQVAEEFKKFNTPFVRRDEGQLILKISITRWIEKSEYGFVIQHEIFDLSDDKIYEFGRTYRVGYIF